MPQIITPTNFIADQLLPLAEGIGPGLTVRQDGRIKPMVIAVEGTFAYIFDVPEAVGSGCRVPGRSREPLKPRDCRLVGHAPMLEAVEYERQPWQLYARITLTASDKHNATVASAAFSVERGLVRMLRPHDVLHIARSPCGGIGLSILRDDHLVAAAGAITQVPLGADVSARFPFELIRESEAIFRTRDPQYHPHEHPIELSIGSEIRILHRGRPTIGPYDVLIRHGFVRGMPGTDACVSIERRGVCPETAAHTTAQLLAEEGLQ